MPKVCVWGVRKSGSGWGGASLPFCFVPPPPRPPPPHVLPRWWCRKSTPRQWDLSSSRLVSVRWQTAACSLWDLITVEDILSPLQCLITAVKYHQVAPIKAQEACRCFYLHSHTHTEAHARTNMYTHTHTPVRLLIGSRVLQPFVTEWMWTRPCGPRQKKPFRENNDPCRLAF